MVKMRDHLLDFDP